MNTDDNSLVALAEQLGQQLGSRCATVATAESCTGGWIAKTLTDIAGSSGWFQTGWVTYSNDAKCNQLGVDSAVLTFEGAVSEPVVRQMASMALKKGAADYAVAVSGIAGPGGGTAEKPVGTVWFAIAVAGGDVFSEQRLFRGDRETIRRQAVAYALQQLIRCVSDSG